MRVAFTGKIIPRAVEVKMLEKIILGASRKLEPVCI